MWWERRSASTAARCAAARCWRSSSASRRAKYSSSFLLGLSVIGWYHPQRVATGVGEWFLARGRGRLAGVAVAGPPHDGVDDGVVLERDDVHRAAGVLTAVLEKEVGVVSHAAHCGGLAPHGVDVALRRTRRDGARVVGDEGHVAESARALRHRRWAGGTGRPLRLLLGPLRRRCGPRERRIGRRACRRRRRRGRGLAAAHLIP